MGVSVELSKDYLKFIAQAILELLKGREMSNMKKKELGLEFIWKIRLQLWAEGSKLRAEGSKLNAEGNGIWAEGNKLWAEGILAVYGNISLEWKNYNSEKKDYECHLETGEVFKP